MGSHQESKARVNIKPEDDKSWMCLVQCGVYEMTKTARKEWLQEVEDDLSWSVRFLWSNIDIDTEENNKGKVSIKAYYQLRPTPSKEQILVSV